MNGKNKIMASRVRLLGMFFSIFLAVVSWIFLLKGISGAVFLSVAAVVLLVVSLLNPLFLELPSAWWCSSMVVLSHFFVHLGLILFYFLILTPLGLLLKLLSKDLLSKKASCTTVNYWNELPKSYWVYSQKRTQNTMKW